jgi:TolB-like protein
MKKYCLLPLIVLTAFVVSGCQSKQKSSTLTENLLAIKKTTDTETDIRDHSLFEPRYHNKQLNDYAQQMVLNFKINKELPGSIAVTSFVEFDQTLTKTNNLGNQLAEAFLIEMRQAGYTVEDINALGGVVVNHYGNFSFSRQEDFLQDNFCCVLSGNLIYQSNGVLVNSKLFNIDTKNLIAASSLVIPYFVIEHLGQAQPRP